ncbi:MAG: class I SAM-dependent methyltransferase [Propionibacteriaceae bacterium]|jgi:hypothetical protein|nr:class I SAM-dependent methyltransferase [Propionibacteriaceae bacterium]
MAEAATVAIAQWLISPDGARALADASQYDDLDSLAAATGMRRNWQPEQAAAALGQTALRRKARRKFGTRADELFFTDAGLQQATRAPVARWRAERLAKQGSRKVVDFGCGLGADALAMLDAGLSVTAVELDPVTAIFAGANLPGAKLLRGRAEDLAAELAARDTAVFLDPARRDGRGQFWGVGGMSPSWEFACGLLAANVGCVKTGPGLPLGKIPPWACATWVSEAGDLVELSIWNGIDGPGSRKAVLLPKGGQMDIASSAVARIGQVGRYLYEPDPAVIRAGGIPQVAEVVNGWLLAPKIGYISSDDLTPTPYACAFEVDEVLPFDTRKIRAALGARDIGKLEIKVRGVDINPAQYRKELRLRGRAAATLILTDTATGAKAVIASRVKGLE